MPFSNILQKKPQINRKIEQNLPVEINNINTEIFIITVTWDIIL